MSNFITSIWKISWIPTSGSTLILLDLGDLTTSEPTRSAQQNNAETGAIFVPDASNIPLGGTSRSFSWNRVRSTSDPRSLAMQDEALFPWGTTGKIRVEVKDGIIINYERSAVLGISPSYVLAPDRLIQAFDARLGKPQFPVFVPGSLTAGVTGAAYSKTVTTMANIAAGFTVSIIAGTLPTGLTLNGSTGVISGTPSAAGTYNFTIRIVDGLGARNHSNASITIT